MQNDKLAPIALFVYNRPEHTLNCLRSLAQNNLAQYSILYIFCDGPKSNASDEQHQRINEVREIVASSKWCKEVIIKKNEQNIGLRTSIISNVSQVINEHGSIIVIEDDLILSSHFLEFMNEGLCNYEDELNVCQISGFSFQLNVSSLQEDSYFLPLTTTWGWATWNRVWGNIDFEGKDAREILSNKEIIKKFNLDGSFDYYSMLQKQLHSDETVSSWGIMFWLNAFKRNYLTLFPKYSLTTNTGFDGTGAHKANNASEQQNDFGVINRVLSFPAQILSNDILFKQLKFKLYKQEYSLKKQLFRICKMLKKYLIN
jgi:hypothetical protein